MPESLAAGGAESKGPLEKFLGLFTEVRKGEGSVVLLLTLNIFLILTAYYIIKPVREALILAAPRGAEFKSYAAAGQAILLLGAVPLYAWLASRVPRRQLINTVTLFFAGNLVLFYLAVKAMQTGSLALGLGFYLWVGVFNLMVPAQFWSFANDVYTPEQGKRLFAIVAFGASLGAVMGSKITNLLIEPLGTDQLLLVSGGILVLSLLLSNTVESRKRQPAQAAIADHGDAGAGSALEGPAGTGETGSEEAPLTKGGSFGLVLRSRYLLLIALLMLFLNWVNTTGEFILGRIVKETIEANATALGLVGDEKGAWIGSHIGAFYADFFFVVNIIGLTVQLFLVSRILKYLGVRIALLFLPIIAFGGYALIGFASLGLALVRWTKTAENATDYSLQNTVRQALFLPTTREEKYKAKQAIDTFFVRAGDVLSALLVYLGLNQLALSTAGFARVNLVLAGIWLAIAVAIGLEYRRRVRE
ncbi:MAG: translocase [Candidatus Eisenbacteria bacterium]|uniref:ADP,ATP carrier protein n=1 Tax=Eiseniibacteriota bacterium TaxID=2212470 RepID=A0A956NHZ9_UNCEI|nr:translocase [Candidatus Eisenbacteria bacterium]